MPYRIAIPEDKIKSRFGDLKSTNVLTRWVKGVRRFFSRPPKFGEPISQQDAQAMLEAYRVRRKAFDASKSSTLSDPSPAGLYDPGVSDTESCWFDREVFENILKQKDCWGIRIYYGLQTQEPGLKGHHNVILVGLRPSRKVKALAREKTLTQKLYKAELARYPSYAFLEDMLDEENLVAIPGLTTYCTPSQVEFKYVDKLHPRPVPLISKQPVRLSNGWGRSLGIPRLQPKPHTQKGLQDVSSGEGQAYDFGGLGPPLDAPHSAF